MHKSFAFITLAFLLVAAIGCKPSINPSFTYTPAEPRAGETITFVNTTNEGEYWNWNFGDGTYSISKNPYKTYKKPGTYTVTLQVDSNSNYTTSQEITVYDTIPYINIDVDSVFYFQTITVKALVYNPYNKKLTYTWRFSEHAISDDITEGESTKHTVSLYYNHYNTEETIHLDVTIGDSIYHVEKTFYIHDSKSNALLITDKEGNLWKQRIYKNGMEEPQKITTYLPQTKPIGIYAEQLFITESDIQLTEPSAWEEGAKAECKIIAYDLSTQEEQTVLSIKEHPTHHVFRAFIRNGQIYWSDYANYLYKTTTDTRGATFVWNESDPTANGYYMASADRLGYFGHTLALEQPTGGIALYADTYFWGKYGNGSGIYRFTEEDILTTPPTESTPLPESGQILSQIPIKQFCLDAIHRKIYYITNTGTGNELWICNMDGGYAIKIADACGEALLVDNASSRLFYTDKDGVKAMRLITTTYNILTDERYFVCNIQATGLVMNAQKR